MKGKKLLSYIVPPGKWKIPAFTFGGLFVGMILYTFYVSNAVSYLSDDPKTCVNCHLMAPEFATWQHSSHKSVTNCNDCHVPHTSFAAKYYFKMKDGLGHATVFTMGTAPQVIKMKEAGIAVVQENCKRCHGDLNQKVSTIEVTRENNLHGAGKLCWDCHREVPHGRVKGQSSTPNAKVPTINSPVPAWLKKIRKK